ncbi:membrane protein [Gordonia phage KappaFarmDelta]|nr:membrane protein [Gordonia phage KappaFarmDelta]
MEPGARPLRPTSMIFDVLAVIACLVGGWWLVTTGQGGAS